MKVRAAACIVENDHILLLQYQYNGHIVYNLPGGNAEFGENLNQTLLRELHEELQVESTIGRQMLLLEHIKDQSVTLHLIFEAKITKNKPTINAQHTTAMAVVWLPLSQLSSVNLYPNVAKALYAKINDTDTKPLYLGVVNLQWF
jgi:8-oxo-dGTP diphosphatase